MIVYIAWCFKVTQNEDVAIDKFSIFVSEIYLVMCLYPA